MIISTVSITYQTRSIDSFQVAVILYMQRRVIDIQGEEPKFTIFSDIYQNLSVIFDWVNRFKQDFKHKETICQVTVLLNIFTIIINNRCNTMVYSQTTCHNKFLRENFDHPSVMAIFRKLMLG